jgi:PAS domain-containing protein
MPTRLPASSNRPCARRRERQDLERIAEVQASAHLHLSRLLNASPAVIYCRSASGDYQPTFVSDSIKRLFGCTPREYLANPYHVLAQVYVVRGATKVWVEGALITQGLARVYSLADTRACVPELLAREGETRAAGAASGTLGPIVCRMRATRSA